MEIREIKVIEKDKFNNIVDHPVQSWEWGEFRERAGNRIFRLGLFDGDKLKEGYLLTIHKIPYTQFCVAMFTQGPEPSREMIGALQSFAKEKNIIFIRVEPRIETNQKALDLFSKISAIPGRPFFNKSTFIIDLTKSEDELLRGMHPKTRYNIRLAARHRIKVEEDNSPKTFEKYLELMDETTRRQKYYSHTTHYHKLMWKTLRSANITHLLKATYKGKVLATWILFVWHNTLYYVYGASSTEHRETMATYAVMWEAIKFGKARGLKYFDLWGKEEGKGYTRFKEGFGGQPVEFAGTWDIVINPLMYKIYIFMDNLRWLVLKLKAKIFPYRSFFK